jgi:hypothetical protein
MPMNNIVVTAVICVIIAVMVIFGINPGQPIFADTAEQTTEVEADVAGNGTSTDADINDIASSVNNNKGILNTIANFDKIYNDALTEPFIKAEGKIYDPDIAEYYRGLMGKTGLTNGK